MVGGHNTGHPCMTTGQYAYTTVSSVVELLVMSPSTVVLIKCPVLGTATESPCQKNELPAEESNIYLHIIQMHYDALN